MSIKLLMVREHAVQAAPLRSAATLLATWIRAGAERARQRRALASLNDSQLKDIGLTRRDVMEESGKSFWRA
ncbi:MAG: DUF1127 domain-containing protein [Rhodospirillaceae bacterium]|nr:DUF1127 domain-containing protein [Rhodospirillaceae bacterium]